MIPTLTPIELAVLGSLTAWRSIGELEIDLEPLFGTHRIRSTIAFLKRERLIEAITDEDAGDRALGRALCYRQTLAGQLRYLQNATSSGRVLYAIS